MEEKSKLWTLIKIKYRSVLFLMSKLDIKRGFWIENVPKWMISVLGESEQSDEKLREIIYEKIRDFDPDVGNSAIRKRFDRAIEYLYETGEIIEIKHHYKIALKSSHEKFSDLINFLKGTYDIVDITFVLDQTTSYIKDNTIVNYYLLLKELKIKLLNVPSRKHLYEKTLFDSINYMLYNLLLKYEDNLISLSPECIEIIKIDFLNEFKNIVNGNLEYLDRFFILFLSHVPSKINIKYIINLICIIPKELWEKHKENLTISLCYGQWPMRKYHEVYIMREIANLEKDKDPNIQQIGKYLHDEFKKRTH